MGKVKQYCNDYSAHTSDPDIIAEAREQSQRFVREENQFHLGFLPTEQSHPYTATLSETITRDIPAGIKQLLTVDCDLPPVARRIVMTERYSRLVDSMRRTIRNEKAICFSGCGSTGRLAILLESMWRTYWNGRGDSSRADLGKSIMTGGDRALIRSVESFEDYQQFGRRQVADIGIGEGDLLIAISEGGETSSVIGTAKEGVDRGCEVYFVYNNPTAILQERITRSAELLSDPRVTPIDLYTGSMALSGSTRLQATTIELFIVGAALDEALMSEEYGVPDDPLQYRLSQVGNLATLINHLLSDESIHALSQFVRIERDTYAKGGLITYFASDYLLDIVSDTTERSPTFSLPPYARFNEDTCPSWAFAKDPQSPTPRAWERLLGRKPRGIDWTRDDYHRMAPQSQYVNAPPELGHDEITSYPIGNEPDPRRFRGPHDHAIIVCSEHEEATSVQSPRVPLPPISQ